MTKIWLIFWENKEGKDEKYHMKILALIEKNKINIHIVLTAYWTKQKKRHTYIIFKQMERMSNRYKEWKGCGT